MDSLNIFGVSKVEVCPSEGKLGNWLNKAEKLYVF